MATASRFQSIFRAGLFKDKVCLLTGGGTGIGRCIAHELSALGATVVITGRRLEPLEATVKEITSAGAKCEAVQMNIRDEAQVDQVVASLVDKHKSIDALVNNAGGQFMSPAENIKPKGWRAVVDTNLNGTWFVSQAVYKHWLKEHGGSIVNIVADMWNGFPMMAHTGAARAAVVNMTKTLGVEWAPAGVRVNAVAPGTILSSGMNNYPEQAQAMIAAWHDQNPTGRFGTESEVSSAVTFLLTDAANYINGETLRVDGASSFSKGQLLPFTGQCNIEPFHSFHLKPKLPDAFDAAASAGVKSKMR